MIKKVRDFFKKKKGDLSTKRDKGGHNQGHAASSEQVKEAAQYVSKRFSRAITQLSER